MTNKPMQPKTPTPHDSLYDWLSYLAKLHVSAIDMGLERVLPVAKHLGIQNPSAKVFTVAGTNGKGSVTKTIATLAAELGLKTGLYQSPHMFVFNERISINGACAHDDELVAAFVRVERARQACQLSLSFFEATTLAAFLLFEKAGCDVWVLEVGLGGRLDVVNIIDPDVAVITNVGIDHTDWLGDSLEKIGMEKAGILRKHIPCILGSDMPSSVLSHAQQAECDIIQAGQDFAWRKPKRLPSCEHEPYWLYSCQALTAKLPLPKLAVNNVATGISAALAGGIHATIDVLARAMAQLSMAGRFEQAIWQNRHVVLDVAHNPHGARFFAEQLSERYPKKSTSELHIVLSMLADKDIAGVAEVLSGRFCTIVWHIAPLTSRAALKRAASCAQIEAALVQVYNKPSHKNNALRCNRYDSLAQALSGAHAASQPDALILVCGSFYTIAEVASTYKNLLP